MGAAPAAVPVELPYRKHEVIIRSRLHLVRLFHSVQSGLGHRAPRYFEVDAAEAAIAYHSKNLEQHDLRRIVLGLFNQTKRKPAEEAWQYFIGRIGAGFHRCDACALHSASPSGLHRHLCMPQTHEESSQVLYSITCCNSSEPSKVQSARLQGWRAR